MDWLPRFLLTNAALLRAGQKHLGAGQPDKAVIFTAQLLARLKRAGEAQDPALASAARWCHGAALAKLNRASDAFVAWSGITQPAVLTDEDLRTLAATWLEARQACEAAQHVWLEFLSRKNARQVGSGVEVAEAIAALSEPANGEPHAPLPRAWNQSVAERAPDLAWPHRHLGLIALAAGQPAEAAAHFTRALEHEAGDHFTRLMLALVCAETGRPAESLSALERIAAGVLAPEEWILRAHIERMLGDTVAALASVRLGVSQGVDLREGDRLLWAELALQSGDEETARVLLAERGDDERWELIAAELAANAGHVQEALARLSGLSVELRAASSIAARLVRWTAMTTDSNQASEALEALPVEAQSDDSRLVAGYLAALRGNLEDAVLKWSSMADERLAEPEVVAIACEQFAMACADGRASAVLSAADYVPSIWWEQATFRDAVTGALNAHLRQSLEAGQIDDAEFTAALEEHGTLACELPGATRLARGLTAAAAGAWDSAAEEFEQMSEEARAGVAPIAIRCAIARDDFGQARTLCATLPEEARPVFEAVLAAREEDWPRCFERLSEVDRALVTSECLGAVALRIDGCVTGKGVVAHYCQAVELCRSQDWARASELLRAFPGNHVWAVSARALTGWIQLRKQPAVDNVQDVLAGVLRDWPDVLAVLPFSPLALLSAQLDVDRTLAAEILRVVEVRREPGDPLTARHRAIFLLAQGSESRSHEEALRHWEDAVVQLAIPLAHFSSLTEWAARREAVFKRSLPSEALTGLEAAVTELCAAWFTERAEAAVSAGKTAAAEALLGLPLLLEAEIVAARRLGEAGGLSLDGASISTGPGYLIQAGLEAELRSMIERLRFRDTELLAWLVAAAGNGDEQESLHADLPDDGKAEDLRYLFSPLRVAWILQEHGQVDRAVSAVKAVRSGTGSWLARANPAFAVEDSDAFENMLHVFLVRLLNRAAEHAMAAGGEALPRALECWRELLGEADRRGRKQAAGALIRRSVLGRVQFLCGQRRAEASALLEQCLALLPEDKELRAAQALILTNDAIDAFNADRNDEAAALIRRAVDLGTETPRVLEHAARILKFQAGELIEIRPWQARCVVEEALTHAHSLCRIVPGRPDHEELAEELERMHLMMSLRTDEPSAQDLLDALPGHDPMAAAKLSTVLHNQGVEKANAREWKAAVELFEIALELEPSSEITTKLLRMSLMDWSMEALQSGDTTTFDRCLSRMMSLT